MQISVPYNELDSEIFQACFEANLHDFFCSYMKISCKFCIMHVKSCMQHTGIMGKGRSRNPPPRR